MPIMPRLLKKRANTLTVPNPKLNGNPKMKMGLFAVVTSSVTGSKVTSFSVSSSELADPLCTTTALDNSPCENPAQRLPRGVLEGIAEQLRALYTNSVGESCEACIVRDISSGTKTCRNWRDGLTTLMSVPPPRSGFWVWGLTIRTGIRTFPSRELTRPRFGKRQGCATGRG